MARLVDRRFLIGGKPALILSGEVHYFRLRRDEWQDRITKAKECGCNAIATYIPWLYHEEREGQIDLAGKRRPETALGAFMDLCKKEGLWFIPRPGPFIMAEVKNEGIPDWVYTTHPGAIPTTWGGKKAVSKNLNYLHPGFLDATRLWYRAVMAVIKPRLEPTGGNVIAVQLDNEIGMLQCWAEEPDLSEDTLCEFATYVQKRYPADALRARYGFDMADPATRAKHLWSGDFPGARSFHADYREFNRDRYAEYASKLREFAEAEGVRDVPFIINIHGSGGGRATTFPIGISQTFRSYTQAPGFWGSSDHYLGDLTRQNVGDLYFLNAFMACVHRPEQPLSSMEFEAGSGDYGENGAVRYSRAAADFKARLSVVQGNRLLNHYLLSGGRNPMLERAKQDGNSRIGTTGERHGFAAPINPEGKLDATYFALKETNSTLGAVSDLLADMDEEHDDVALGFVPDYYSTDVKRPGPIMTLVSQLEAARGPLEGMVRSMMACGLSFPAVNLQSGIPAGTKVVALACASCLDTKDQGTLAEFVKKGGRLLLYGRLPVEDFEGKPATLLIDELGVKPEAVRSGSSSYFPSLAGSGWAAGEPEVRVWQVQPYRHQTGQAFLTLAQTDLAVGATMKLGTGLVTCVTAELPLHLSLWRGILDRLGARPGVEIDSEYDGVILNRVRDRKGQRFISLLNLDLEPKRLQVNGLIPRPVYLGGKQAKLLPVEVRLEGLEIAWSTTEIARRRSGALAFRQGNKEEYLVLRGPVHMESGEARVVETSGGEFTVSIKPGDGLVWIKGA